MRIRSSLIMLTLLLGTPSVDAEDLSPYVAVLNDGTRVEGHRLTDWSTGQHVPHLDGRPLQNNEATLSWLRNRKAVEVKLNADDTLFEFINGDRLPGRLIGIEKPATGGVLLVVRPSAGALNRAGDVEGELRVRADGVRRIVWKPVEPITSEGGAATLHDGTQVPFLQHRWSEDAITLLTDRGVRELEWSELAAVHFPRRDPWETYFRELAVLSPGVQTPLIRLETSSGLVMTGSRLHHEVESLLTAQQRAVIALKKRRYDQRLEQIIRVKASTAGRMDDVRKKMESDKARYLERLERDEAKSRESIAKRKAQLANAPESTREHLQKLLETHMRIEANRLENARQSYKRYAVNLDRGLERMKLQVVRYERQLVQLRKMRDAGPPGSIPNGRWLLMLKPAWSSGPMWVRFETVRTLWSFPPQQVPLTRIAPIRSTQRSLGVWPWHVDRSARGGPLRSGNADHGWGFGVHAYNELWFEVPACAESFETRVGLDAAATRFGCVRARVFLDRSTGTPLYESPVLIGSDTIVRSPTMPLDATESGGRYLVLVADDAHDDRPAGADPLDIRDDVNWIEPRLNLDAEKLRARVQSRSTTRAD